MCIRVETRKYKVKRVLKAHKIVYDSIERLDENTFFIKATPNRIIRFNKGEYKIEEFDGDLFYHNFYR